jgi:hypothetical protein
MRALLDITLVFAFCVLLPTFVVVVTDIVVDL